MTEKQILQWIKTNLSEIISRAVADSKTDIPESVLAAMAMREVNNKILKYADMPFDAVCKLMKGDYGQRDGEKEKSYHGFGFWQIDIGSFPDFIKSNDWEDPYKCCLKAVSVLEGKRKYLVSKLGSVEIRAVIASYNCGEGNVYKAIKGGKDIDLYTHNHDYSKEVLRYQGIYNSLA